MKREDGDGSATFTYDKAGNLKTASDLTGTVSLEHDSLYRITGVQDESGDSTLYTYDASSNITEILYPDGNPVTRDYNSMGWVSKITDHDGQTVQYTYDAVGQITKEQYQDKSATDYDYNAAGFIIQIKEVAPNKTTRREILFGYDDDGNLLSELRRGVDVDKRQESVFYTYDKENRLVKTVSGSASETYTYDKAGNLLTDGTDTYTYDIQNRILTKNGQSYTYDNAGNLLDDGSITYEYDARNRLIRGETNAGEISEYTYNALGARVQNVQQRINWNESHSNTEFNNGSELIRDYMGALGDDRATWQPTWETEVGTTVQAHMETVTYNYTIDYLSFANRDIIVEAEGQYVQRYVYGADGNRLSVELTYADGTNRGEFGENIISDMATQDITKVMFRENPLGSSLLAVDQNGNILAHMIYDPWGEAQIETKLDANFAGITNLNNFTGYTWDETLGLYFAQSRFYDPATRRFTQEDSASAGINWYAYCGDNPLTNIDPWGTMSYVMYDAYSHGGNTGFEYSNATHWGDALDLHFGTGYRLLNAGSPESFKNDWNDELGKDQQGNEVSIDSVVIIAHGKPTSFIGDFFPLNSIYKLDRKIVPIMFLSVCEAGNLNYSQNVASTFASLDGVGRVIAGDGLVYPYDDPYISAGDPVGTRHYLNANRGDLTNENIHCSFMPEYVCPSDGRKKRTECAGWILYEGNIRIQVAKTGRLAISDLIGAGIAVNISDHAIEHTIKITRGDPYMYVDGVKEEIDPGRGTAPILKNDRLMLPMTAVVTAMGGGVEPWDQEKQTATYTYMGNVISINMSDKPSIKTTYATLPRDVDPFVENGRTFVPLRQVAEVMGAKVDWDNKTQTATLTYYSYK